MVQALTYNQFILVITFQKARGVCCDSLVRVSQVWTVRCASRINTYDRLFIKFKRRAGLCCDSLVRLTQIGTV